MADLTVRDPSFGIDVFDRPNVYSASETVVRNILLILFGRPGFYPSMPRLGVHIQDYMYELEEDMDTVEIKSTLATQCSDLLDPIRSGELDVMVKHYHNNPMLFFVLPTIYRGQSSELYLGVVLLDNGEMQFNFVFSEDDVSII